jgi:hypothetical protein
MRVVLAVAVLALAFVLESCGGCDSYIESLVTVNAHVPFTPIELAGANLRVCRNNDCATGTATTMNWSRLIGASFEASAELVDEYDGYTLAEVTASVVGTDGDVWSISITSATGETLLSVRRPVPYDHIQDCGGAWSTEAQLDLYPTSLSDIECGGASCRAGVGVDGSFMTTDLTTPVTITLCRNGNALCTSYTWPISRFLRSGNTVGYAVGTVDDSAVLADGDVYRLTVVQGAAPLVDQSWTVTYVATFLNGWLCDPVPCRTQSLMVP